MSAHTPGPWEPRESKTSNYLWEIVATSKRGITYVIARLAKPNQGEREANARLIAAAPDLLAALQALLPDAEANHCGGPDTAARLAQARAAIAKAVQP